MSTNRLDVLRDNREALWYVELAGWLHNIGKLHPEFLGDDRKYAYEHPTGWLVESFGKKVDDYVKTLKKPRELGRITPSQEMFRDLLPQTWLKEPRISLPIPLNDHRYSIAELIELQALHWYATASLGAVTGRSSSRLSQLLMQAHNRASNVEKEGNDDHIAHGQQGRKGAYLDNSLGRSTRIDGAIYLNLWRELGETPEARAALMAKRARFIAQLRRAGGPWTADPRWPVNDVTLFAMGFAAAAFLKAFAAKVLIEGKFPDLSDRQPAFDNLQVRTLRVALDGPAFFGRVARIPDVKARREIVQRLLDGARDRLENRFPIGNEIYRDEFGACFLIPALESDVHELVLQEVKLEVSAGMREADTDAAEEIVAAVHVTDQESHGLLSGEAIRMAPPQPRPDASALRRWWSGKSGDVCAVCQLRPAEPDGEGRRRKTCSVCEERRDARAADWCKDPSTTIWLDEVADNNGRVAIIAGRFWLDDWLSQKGRITETLWTVRYEVNKHGGTPKVVERFDKDGEEVWTPKNASFARQRRIWETTREYWETGVSDAALRAAGVQCRSSRVELQFEHKEGSFRPRRNQAYYLNIGKTRVSVLCDGARFLVIENLSRLARGEDAEQNDNSAPVYVAKRLQGQEVELEEPTGYGSPNKLRGKLTITDARVIDHGYVPVIRIMEEPQSLLLAVPAVEATKIVEFLRQKYEMEFEKVRAQMPVTFGILFSQADTPLYSMLDAVRRMVERKPDTESWTIETLGLLTDESRLVRFKNGVEWRVRMTIGDESNATRRQWDLWYPYFRVNGKPLTVPVWELNEGDVVKVDPSTFDFEMLDSARSRFEIGYGADNRRLGAGMSQRPYPLEWLPKFEELWGTLVEFRFATKQLQWLAGMLREKYEAWDVAGTPERRADWLCFGRDTIRNLAWPGGNVDEGAVRELDGALESGLLLDTLELYLKIFKMGQES